MTAGAGGTENPGRADVEWIHASAVAVGEAGVLILGPSGAGKTALGAALVEAARARARFGAWIGDDRIGLALASGRILARPHPRAAGWVERRGLGLTPEPFLARARLDLVVSLADPGAERLPPADDLWLWRGAALPVLRRPPGAPCAVCAILRRLRDFASGGGL